MTSFPQTRAKKEGPPTPARTALPLSVGGFRKPLPRFRPRGPPKIERSSTRTCADDDNETLDHLLPLLLPKRNIVDHRRTEKGQRDEGAVTVRGLPKIG